MPSALLLQSHETALAVGPCLSLCWTYLHHQNLCNAGHPRNTSFNFYYGRGMAVTKNSPVIVGTVLQFNPLPASLLSNEISIWKTQGIAGTTANYLKRFRNEDDGILALLRKEARKRHFSEVWQGKLHGKRRRIWRYLRDESAMDRQRLHHIIPLSMKNAHHLRSNYWRGSKNGIWDSHMSLQLQDDRKFVRISNRTRREVLDDDYDV